jgi:hypothetical protein
MQIKRFEGGTPGPMLVLSLLGEQNARSAKRIEADNAQIDLQIRSSRSMIDRHPRMSLIDRQRRERGIAALQAKRSAPNPAVRRDHLLQNCLPHLQRFEREIRQILDDDWQRLTNWETYKALGPAEYEEVERRRGLAHDTQRCIVELREARAECNALVPGNVDRLRTAIAKGLARVSAWNELTDLPPDMVKDAIKPGPLLRRAKERLDKAVMEAPWGELEKLTWDVLLADDKAQNPAKSAKK